MHYALSIVRGLCVVHCALWILSCSVPTLESQQCNDASLAAKQFYSFHLGNDMAPSPEQLEARKRFLTPALYSSLNSSTSGTHDYFTNSDQYPKTFKIGKCEPAAGDHANVQVQVYWQEEHGSTKDTTQRSLNVEMVKQNDTWLVNSVTESGK